MNGCGHWPTQCFGKFDLICLIFVAHKVDIGGKFHTEILICTNLQSHVDATSACPFKKSYYLEAFYWLSINALFSLSCISCSHLPSSLFCLSVFICLTGMCHVCMSDCFQDNESQPPWFSHPLGHCLPPICTHFPFQGKIRLGRDREKQRANMSSSAAENPLMSSGCAPWD